MWPSGCSCEILWLLDHFIMQNSKFLLLSHQGHQNFIQYIPSDLYFLLSQISKVKLKRFRLERQKFLRGFSKFVLTEDKWCWSVCWRQLNKNLLISPLLNSFNVLNRISVCSLGFTPDIIVLTSWYMSVRYDCNTLKNAYCFYRCCPQNDCNISRYGFMKE